MNEAEGSPKMKDFTRPTLCVIDENGISVTDDESETLADKDFIRPTLCVIDENGIAVTDVEQEISNDKDLTRPTLCVIDENGIQITEDEIEILGDENHNRKTSLTDVFHPDLSDRLSFVQNHIASIDNSRTRSPTLRRKIPVRDHNSNVTSCEDTDLGETDLSELKATATRLNLRTRRQSYVTWKDQYIDHKSSVKPSLGKLNTDQTVTENGTNKPDDEFTEERKNRINEALGWLRNELVSYVRVMPLCVRLYEEITLASALFPVHVDSQGIFFIPSTSV